MKYVLTKPTKKDDTPTETLLEKIPDCKIECMYKTGCKVYPNCSMHLPIEEPEPKKVDPLRFYRAIDKLDRLGWGGVKQLLGPGRMDPSGDFTEGCGYSDDQIECIMIFMKWGSEGSNEDRLRKMALWSAVMNMKFDK